MRKQQLIAAICAAGMILAGCSSIPGTNQTTEASPAESTAEAAAETTAEAADAAAPAPESTETGSESSDNTENGENTEADAAGPGSKEDSAGAEEQAEANIFNNAGYFVKEGTKVYYRVPGGDNLRVPELWGRYVNTTTRGGSYIACYDTESEEQEMLFSDDGFGPIGISGGYFYFQEQDAQGNSIVERVTMDGQNREQLEGAMTICGADGQKIAVSGFDSVSQGLGIDVYEGTEKISTVVPEGQIAEFIGIGSGYLIYETIEEADNGKYDFDIWSHSLDTGVETRLGRIPPSSEYGGGWMEKDQVLLSEGKLILALGAYDGTGHFYSGGCFMEGDPSVEGSLSVIDYESVPHYSPAVPDSADTVAAAAGDSAGAEEGAESDVDAGIEAAESAEQSGEMSDNADDEMWRSPAFALIDGQLMQTEGIPGTAEVNDKSGMLGYFDENGGWNPSAPDWGTVTDDIEGTRTHLELAEYVDGDIFAYWNEEWRAEEADVGWREAYERKFAYIYIVDAETGKTELIGSAQNPTLVEGDADQSEAE